MPVRSEISEEQDHPPALSGTRTAWTALLLLTLVIALWLFFNPLACGLLKSGLSAASWLHGEQLRIGSLSLGGDGSFRAQEVEWNYGPKEHRSSWKSDWLILRPTPLWNLIRPGKYEQRTVIREMLAGRTKLLVDHREIALATAGKGPQISATDFPRQTFSFLPAACTAGPIDVVVIGESYRASLNGLYVRLPERWAGKISFTEGTIDIGSWHHTIPRSATAALLEGNTLHVGALDLGHELGLKELTLATTPEGVEFGVRGTVGKGLLRGDGVIGAGGKARNLEVTLVGEGLALAAFSPLMNGGNQASGTISQARFTFRGDTAHPLEAESSLRLIAQDFQWEGRGWESLRLAATLTGRNLTVTEFSLQQHDNELTAEGQSRLPEDWRAVLRAPFTASFSAQLADAGALGALVGPEFSQLGGSLSFDGEIKGADNKADGYCNVTGNGLRIRELPVDWMKGCLLFEGESTRLSNLDAWSGTDHLTLNGTVANRRPHSYNASASVAVQNLTKRLSQIGVTTAESMGAGAVKGTWQGEGSSESNTGSFQASFSEWITSRTREGTSGNCEGTYANGQLNLTRAELRQDDLKLGFKLCASDKKLEAKEIVAVRGEKTKPLVEGSFALPLNAADFWKSGSLVRTLVMTEPLSVNLLLHGIKAEELTDLLGQPRQFAGTLDGTLVATGTSEKPLVHCALQVRKFATRGEAAPQELAITFDSDKGRAAAELVEQPSGTTPLHIRAELPLLLTNEKGRLLMADAAGSISGAATFHQAPLDGWMSLIGINGCPLHQVTVDGKLTMSGTFDKPSLEGDINLKAGVADLFGTQKLQQLVAPVSLKGHTGQLMNGSAAYRGVPLSLTGSVDWGSTDAALQIQLVGKNLSLEFGDLGKSGNNNAGTRLNSIGAAALTLSAKGTNNPTLGGTIFLSALFGSPLPRLTPCFAPPGIRLNPISDSELANDTGTHHLQLDLVVKTEAALTILSSLEATKATNATNVSAADLPQLAMDLRLKGWAQSPSVAGTLTATRWPVQLPCGRFVIPEAALKLEDGVETSSLSGTAYGITRLGLCALTITGGLSKPEIGFAGPLNVTAPDLLLALAMPSESIEAGKSNMEPAQVIAWNRQKQLFPLTSANWMASLLGNQDQGALGFYGAPWIWSVDQGSGKTNQTPKTPKQETN